MARRRIATLAVVLAGCVGVGAGSAVPAGAYQWLSSYKLNPGEDVYHHPVTQVWGKSVGAAATCAGLRGWGAPKCGGEGQMAYSPISELGVEGYIHNHSTWTSWFNAWAN